MTVDSFDHVADPKVVALADEGARRVAALVEAGRVEGEELLAACVAEMRGAGVLRITVPAELGGLGGSVVDACVALEKLSAALGSAGLAANMHLQYIGGALVSGLWPEAMLARFLRGVVEHGWLINNCQAEPEMGSPARGGLPATTATRADGGWLLSGRKSWATASTQLTHLGVSATVRAPDVPEHLGQFLVRADSAGVSIDRTWRALSMRESASHDFVFNDVFVPDDHVIRVSATGETYRPPLDVAPWHGLPFAATYVGIAVAARNWVARFAATRTPTNLGYPIGQIPGVQRNLGEIEALLFAARRVVFVRRATGWSAGRTGVKSRGRCRWRSRLRRTMR